MTDRITNVELARIITQECKHDLGPCPHTDCGGFPYCMGDEVPIMVVDNPFTAQPTETKIVPPTRNCIDDCVHCLAPDDDRQFYPDDYYCAALNLKVASGVGVINYSAMAEGCQDFEN